MDVFATMGLVITVRYHGLGKNANWPVRNIVKMDVIEKMENVRLASPTGMVKNVNVLVIALVNYV